MNRRAFVTGLGAVLAAPLAAEAREVGRIGTLGFLTTPVGANVYEMLREGLGEHGWIADCKISIAHPRYADSQSHRLEHRATLKVDVSVQVGNQAIATAKRATLEIRLIMHAANHPVETGFVASFSHPGRHVTRTGHNPTQVAGELVAVLKEAFPRISRVAMIWNPFAPGALAYKAHVDRAARAVGVTLQRVPVCAGDDVRVALDTIGQGEVEGLYVGGDAVTSSHELDIRAFAAHQRLPAVYATQWWIEHRGLICYGVTASVLWPRSAHYADVKGMGASRIWS